MFPLGSVLLPGGILPLHVFEPRYRDMVRDAKYMRLATRICAELGATYVKTYYVEDGFDTVAAACCPAS